MVVALESVVARGLVGCLRLLDAVVLVANALVALPSVVTEVDFEEVAVGDNGEVGEAIELDPGSRTTASALILFLEVEVVVEFAGVEADLFLALVPAVPE